MSSRVAYPTLPECPLYHPDSELNGKAGWYPNISSSQLAAANSLRASLEREGYWEDFNYDEENEFLKLLRFLRARKFDVPKTLEMCRNDVIWRREEDRYSIRFETAAETLQCADTGPIFEYFPCWVQGRDKQQRPVAYRQFGKLVITEVMSYTTMERLVRFHAWEAEQALRLSYESSRENNCNIETFVLVVDAAGWQLKLATSEAFTFIKGMIATDSDHYPERLGRMMLINAPGVLSFAWRIIQTFLDDVQKAKIMIMGKEAEWQPVLFEAIDQDQIPKMYGGFAEDPSPASAFASMDPPREAGEEGQGEEEWEGGGEEDQFEEEDEEEVEAAAGSSLRTVFRSPAGRGMKDPHEVEHLLKAAKCELSIHEYLQNR